MQTRTYLLILLFGLLLTGCSRPLYQQQFYIFGTLVGLSIWDVPEQQASEAVNTIVQDFQTMHRHWHAWQPGPLTDLNQALATGQVWTVSEPSLVPLLEQAQLFYNQTNGLVNPAIGRLIALWGFHQDELPTNRLPSSAEIAELVQLAPNMADIQIEAHQVSSRNPAVQLDFGAFAKGYAVDLAIKKLRQLGIENTIINAGGNLKAIGQKGKQPWVIGIRHPNGQDVLAAVALNGEESVMTSGDYERFREYEGQRYSHIIDPRNGQPVRGLTSVTVIDQNGALADAASTALMIAGLSDWHQIAQQMKIKYAMLVDDSGTLYMNPAMAKRIKLNPKQKAQIVVSEPLF